jgi:hypothetical protein
MVEGYDDAAARTATNEPGITLLYVFEVVRVDSTRRDFR